MEYIVEKQGDFVIYSLKGNLIGETHGIGVIEAINEHLASGERRFIVDLAQLEHINSTGLGMLVTMFTKARNVGGDLVLVNPSKFVQGLLLITKLNSIFKIFDSKEQAIAEFPEL